MKRQRAPYAKRSVWIVVAVLAVVVVVGCVVAGYEINHLHNEVNGLQNEVTTIYEMLLKLSK
jgi:hypothetical protein